MAMFTNEREVGLLIYQNIVWHARYRTESGSTTNDNCTKQSVPLWSTQQKCGLCTHRENWPSCWAIDYRIVYVVQLSGKNKDVECRVNGCTEPIRKQWLEVWLFFVVQTIRLASSFIRAFTGFYQSFIPFISFISFILIDALIVWKVQLFREGNIIHPSIPFPTSSTCYFQLPFD